MDKASKPQDGEQRTTGPIVHMRADSDTLLEEMFQAALKGRGSMMPMNASMKPMKERRLPPSFWKPPGTGTKSPSSHSRENSLDSASLQDPYSPSPMSPMNTGPQRQQQQPPPPALSGSHHSRAHSSPATLQHNLVMVQQQQQQQQQQLQQQLQHSVHQRGASFDVNVPNADASLGPLPSGKTNLQHQTLALDGPEPLNLAFPGWEANRTAEGQLYFMNHITKTTQWEDPRVLLPKGWEQALTPEGDVYFIDHNTKRTQWEDPRKPHSAQNIPHRAKCMLPAAPGAVTQVPGGSQAMMNHLNAQKAELQKREAILKRKMELQQQARLQQAQRLGPTSDISIQPVQEMLMRQSLNESNDPFLTSTQQQQQNSADLHNRQESADSGLGMGSNFNLGSIPEDISGMESMDTGDLDTTLTGETTPTPTSAPSGPGGQSSDDPMMTSLPEELEGDLFSLMSSSRPGQPGQPVSVVSASSNDTLTWL
jgi:protein yorkie